MMHISSDRWAMRGTRWMILCLMMLVQCAILCAHAGNTRFSRRRLNTQLVKTAASQYGVHHVQLSGPVQLTDGNILWLHAYVYYKALRAGNHLVLRAQAFFFDAKEDPLMPPEDPDDPLAVPQPYHTQPHALTQLAQPLRLTLQPAQYGKALFGGDGVPSIVMQPMQLASLDDGVLASLRAANSTTQGAVQFSPWLLHGRHNITLPLMLNATLPQHDILQQHGVTDFYLGIDGWAYKAMLPYTVLWASAEHLWEGKTPHNYSLPHTRMVKDATTSPQPPSFVTVYKPLYHGAWEEASALLEVHLQAQLRMGFARGVLYERGSFVSLLSAPNGLGRLAKEGGLEVLLWTHEAAGAPLLSATYVQQRVYENHGHTYDVDIVYSHAALCHWGMHTWLFFADVDDFIMLPPSASIQQLTVQGSQCGDYFANASLLQFHRNNVYCDANAPTLAQIANHQQNGTILEARHLQCAHKQHQDAKPRFLVAADATGAVGAAYATVFDWAAASARWVPASCASVAHLLNMRGEHTWAAPEGEGATEERAWMWVLQEVVGE